MDADADAPVPEGSIATLVCSNCRFPIVLSHNGICQEKFESTMGKARSKVFLLSFSIATPLSIHALVLRTLIVGGPPSRLPRLPGEDHAMDGQHC